MDLVTYAINKKYTDKKVSELSEEIVEVSTLTATTDLADSYKDLPDGIKTIDIYSDDIFGNTAYISTSVDFVPHGGFDRAFPFRNIVVAKKGRGWTLKGTAELATTLHFTDAKGDMYIPVPSEYAGATADALVFTSENQGNISLTVTFYDASKNSIGKMSAGFKTGIKSMTIPEGTAYIHSKIYMQPNIPFDYEFQFYVFVSNQVRAVPLTGAVTRAEVSENTFTVLPYKSTASFSVPIKQYIDNYAGGGTVTYLTPEDFGAIGDGSTDDGEAIAACLQAASETGKSVLMAQKYFTSQPVVISQNALDVTINDLVYSGTDCAVKISGRESTIKIRSIVSGGVGIGIYADNQKSTSYNMIDVNTISSQSHGICFYKGSSYAHQNTVRFSLIRAGGAGCYGIAFVKSDIYPDCFIAECNLYGGQIANCEWAVYKVGGNSKCYGFEIEENVQGGFYTEESGGLIIFYPRSAESSRDGSHAFLKFTGTDNVHVYLSSKLAINEIDLEDAIDTFTADNSERPVHEGRFAKIIGGIGDRLPATGSNPYSAQIYATETYIWGKNMIFRPRMDYRCNVTTETLDTRLIGTSGEYGSTYLTQLPTCYDVTTCNTTINLHASYCAFGITEFTVTQSNGFAAQITDHTGKVIFDGTQFGDGMWKIKAWKDKTTCDSVSAHLLRADLGGQVWTAEPVLTAEDYRALKGLISAT